MRSLLRKSADDQNRCWYALYTRPRFEKKVEKGLHELKIEAFLPVKTVTKYWSDRKKLIDEPLFPSYVFVYANSKERFYALQPRGVVRMVGFNGQPTRVPDEQISAVRRMLMAGYTPLTSNAFAKGDEVEIVAGPLMGLRGFVSEHRGSNHFTIFIDGISQYVAVRIEACYLRRISN